MPAYPPPRRVKRVRGSTQTAHFSALNPIAIRVLSPQRFSATAAKIKRPTIKMKSSNPAMQNATTIRRTVEPRSSPTNQARLKNNLLHAKSLFKSLSDHSMHKVVQIIPRLASGVHYTDFNEKAKPTQASGFQ
jgi:hypothetical protein